MKVTVEMDLTPKEARELLGLPDLQPLQDAMVARMQENMEQAAARLDPEDLVKAWMPLGQQGLEQLQRFLFGAAGAAAAGRTGGTRSGEGS
ncbi:DUF6489 family protein [Futiania mangrovi]|uniref:DUF6489 family protein n=1 Tax=Futiania mangrovi TaxID=2959716 RepID=A0A9J6PF95_9PROT|nr:DUF6489 family protein [Futiania mangrovii]MCP1336504.1 DUF6489 family protein [Futiania mangrovii]